MVPVMLTRDPAELYRENRKKTEGDSFRGGESEKLLPRLFVTKKGVSGHSARQVRGREQNGMNCNLDFHFVILPSILQAQK